MHPDFVCDIGLQEPMQLDDVSSVVQLIKEGGFCLLPSDSAYIMTGLPTIPGITKDLDTVLKRHGLPISVTFGNLQQADDLIGLSTMAKDFINQLVPGGLTFVAVPKEDSVQSLALNRLKAPGIVGAIGLRITESLVETQIAAAINYPLPSTPVRRLNGSEVYTSKEAFDIIENRVLSMSKPRKIAIVNGVVPYPGRLSTVVKEVNDEGLWHIVVIREGAISTDIIHQVAVACQYEGAVVRRTEAVKTQDGVQ